MKNVIFSAFVLILFVVGFGSLYLSNTGILSIGKSYVRKKSADLHPPGIPVAFVGVNVIPMHSERILLDQTVIVRNGLIERIGDSDQVTAPEDALVIEGMGQYLMPGLVDMHVHVEDENDLLLYVANGVTTVRNLWGNTGGPKQLIGNPDQLALRDQINRGELFGPTIYTAGPIMEGKPATMPFMPVFETPEGAAESVAWQKTQGYDFIKVYDNLSADTYQAILQAAREHDIPVVGHIPFAIDLEQALAGGQLTIEHLTGYIDPDAAEFVIPEDQLAHYAELTRQEGVWNCPTIGIYQNTVPADEIDRLAAQPGVQYMSPFMRAFMRFSIGQMGNSLKYSGQDYPARINEIYTQMTSALHKAGAKVVLGTDTSNSYLVPGFSLHDELGHLINAGFTSYEAVETGTRNAAEALGRLDEFGTVAEGKRADLLLLEKNPLNDVSNASKRVGVMLRGQWLPEAILQEMLVQLADSHTPTFLERIWPLTLIALGIFLIVRRLL